MYGRVGDPPGICLPPPRSRPTTIGCSAAYIAARGADEVERRGVRSSGRSGTGLSIALGALLDGVPESMVHGIGVAVGGSVSIGFLVAVVVSNLPEGLSATAELRPTRSGGWIYRLRAPIAVLSALAAAVGYAVAHQVSALDGRYVQALAAGAVLTMLSDSMMPEAFREGGRPIALLTALGFAVATVITTLE